MSNKCKILVGVGVLSAFILGSTLGDDLLESLATPQKESLGEIFEKRGEPISHEEVKTLARRCLIERGFDPDGFDDLKGMTTESGYIVTALNDGKFVATCFIHKNLEHVEMSRPQ